MRFAGEGSRKAVRCHPGRSRARKANVCALVAKHSPHLLQRIVHTSPDVIYLYDLATGRCSFLSGRVQEVLGYSADVLQGKSSDGLSDLIHPEDREHARRQMDAARHLEDGAVSTIEFRYKTGNRDYCWFRSKASVLSRAPDGTAETLVGILSDIDQLKRARIDRTNAIDTLTAILTAISDCYFTVDRNCRITEINPAALQWLNMQRADVVGKHYSKIFKGTSAEAVRKTVKAGVATSLELPSRIRPGRWIELRVYPWSQGCSVLLRDITSRKQAERAAKRSRALLNSSIDALTAQVAILDDKGSIVAYNKAWQRFAELNRHGGPPARIGSKYVKRPAAAAKLPREFLNIRNGMESLLAGKRPEYRCVYPHEVDGRTSWYQFTARRFLSEGEQRYVVANEDVTEVRTVRLALDELSERLRMLQEEERQRIAEELHDSTVQHLVAIGLNAARLRSKKLTDAGIDKLWDELDRSLEEATKELRTFTYLLYPPRLMTDGLSVTLRDYATGFEERTGLSINLRIGRRLDKLPPPLQQSILRIVQEALANVHRHAQASHVAITLRDADGQLSLRISDDGCGIATETAPNGAPRPRAGVGIQAMRGRVSQFGGRLDIIRRASGGTTVQATIPLEGGLYDVPAQA